MATACPREYPSVPSRGFTSRRAKKTIVRYRKKMVSAEQMPLNAFAITAARPGPVNIVKILVKSW